MYAHSEHLTSCALSCASHAFYKLSLCVGDALYIDNLPNIASFSIHHVYERVLVVKIIHK